MGQAIEGWREPCPVFVLGRKKRNQAQHESDSRTSPAFIFQKEPISPIHRIGSFFHEFLSRIRQAPAEAERGGKAAAASCRRGDAEMSYLLPHLHSGWAMDQAMVAQP